MLIPTHIIDPNRGSTFPVYCELREKLNNSYYAVGGDLSNGGFMSITSPTESEAVAKWNSAFSKAPIQYTDKGKVCD